MFNDPNHPDLQRLAQHHDAGTHDQIPAQEAAAAVVAFHEQADPQIVQQVTAQHYENMAPAQLQQAAQQLKDKLAGVAGTSRRRAAGREHRSGHRHAAAGGRHAPFHSQRAS